MVTEISVTIPHKIKDSFKSERYILAFQMCLQRDLKNIVTALIISTLLLIGLISLSFSTTANQNID
jgi:hypothetical protein